MVERLIRIAVAASCASPLWAQPGSVPVAPMGLEVNDGDASQALIAFATARDIGLVARGLLTNRRSLSVAAGPDEEVLAQLGQVYGLSVVMWRGLVLAEPQRRPDDTRSLLKSSLAAEVAPLLLRGHDDGSASTAGFDCVLDAIRLLVRGDASGDARLQGAAAWMAAPELRDLLRQWDSVERGAARLTIVGRTNADGRKLIRDEDPCQYHFRIVVPATGVGEDEEPLSIHCHGPQYDRFREALVERKAVIPLENYVQRLTEAAEAELRPWAAEPAYSKRVSLEVPAPRMLQAVLNEIGPEEGPVSCDERLAATPVMVGAKDVKAADLCLALALVSGGVLLPGEAGLVIAAPASLDDAVFAALPLPWRATATLTCVERDAASQALARRLGASLELRAGDTPPDFAPRAMATMPPVARTMLRRLAQVSLARLYVRWRENLPDRAGRVPLWVYENQEIGRYELAAPGRSEFMGGELYARLKAELTGKEVKFSEPHTKHEGEGVSHNDDAPE